MQLSFACPVCGASNHVSLAGTTAEIACPCGWTRDVSLAQGRPPQAPGDTPAADDPVPPSSVVLDPSSCLVCGCDDLWRQKDFPQKLGLAIVGLGIVLSTLAWAWHRPWLAIGILMAFALADLLLYLLMPDVLVCYRCGARQRHGDIDDAHPGFELETAERYRQERIRLAERTAGKGARVEG